MHTVFKVGSYFKEVHLFTLMGVFFCFALDLSLFLVDAELQFDGLFIISSEENIVQLFFKIFPANLESHVARHMDAG